MKKMYFVIGLSVLLLAGCGDSRTPREIEISEFYHSIADKCSQLVISSLRSPSTAEIPRSGWRNVGGIDDDKVVIYNHVDAQNAFGAVVRQNFSCVFVKEGEKHWKLTDMNI